nr:type I DNA topoisomerase [uncultured Fusobacterium sp.]
MLELPKKSEKNKLVIVESPAKAKTIEKILGRSYKVISSYGHIIDLPKTKIGVDVNNDFKPSYHTIKGKGEVIKQLKEAFKKADKIYLASDPDREGESIAWHIANTLKLDYNEKNRIEFHEITEKAIKDAVKNPRKINIARVNSQQARRILDRLVGYEISPFLWKLISPNTSAGRVQSVALKIICELEDKIKAFVPEKYWDVKGIFDGKYNLNLYKIDNEKIDKLKDEKLLDRVKKDFKKKYEVISSKVSKKIKNPPLPLKTSTLQQLASSYLGFSASKTMTVAQKLYEGISIKGEHKGLITYMRTDSTRISEEAKEMARNYIIKEYGKEYLGSASPKTKKENKNVQDAHEGIRPTDINLTPQNIMQYLDKDQFKLYNLIWQRFLISQLAAMKYEQFEYILEKDKIQYRGTINKIIFDGYYKVFKEDEDLPIGDFPEIKEGDKFTLDKLDIKEDYTRPPARLTESSLVKTLEAEGIGRPSTYASIIDTLKKREYVELQNKSFVPTEIGYEVKTQLDKFFPNIMNIKFTAKLEDELDEVDSGDKNWIDLLKVFYTELQKYEEKCKSVVEEELEKLVVSDVLDKNGKPMIMKIGRFGRYLASQDTESKENISLKGIDISLEDIKKGKIFVKKQIEELSKKKEGQKTDIILDNGSRLLLRYGRFGAYLESENYKEDNIRKTIPKEIKTKIENNTIKKENDILCLKDIFDKIEKEEAEILKKAGKCEKCGRPFKIKNGRWGKFLACTGYPECKNIKKIEKK